MTRANHLNPHPNILPPLPPAFHIPKNSEAKSRENPHENENPEGILQDAGWSETRVQDYERRRFGLRVNASSPCVANKTRTRREGSEGEGGG